MRLAQLGGCDAAARSQGTERCCRPARVCSALRLQVPPNYVPSHRVWTGALSGESLLDKRQPRGPICQQAVNRLSCGPTHTHRCALAALITAGRAQPSILLGCAAQAVPKLAVAKPRYRTAGFLCARHARGICRYGFQAECVERPGVHIGQQCWEQLNAVFDWLVRAVAPAPAAAARLVHDVPSGFRNRAREVARVRVRVSAHGRSRAVCLCVCASVCACACVCVCAMDGRGLGGAGFHALPCDQGAVLCSRSRLASPGRILCLHSGLGAGLIHIDQIRALQRRAAARRPWCGGVRFTLCAAAWDGRAGRCRWSVVRLVRTGAARRPLSISHDGTTADDLLLMDILWSDPTDRRRSSPDCAALAHLVRLARTSRGTHAPTPMCTHARTHAPTGVGARRRSPTVRGVTMSGVGRRGWRLG